MMKATKLHTRTTTPGGENYRYWIASNGAWIVKENDSWKAVLPVNATEELDLQPLEREVTLKDFFMPFHLVSRAIAFFRHVANKHNSEAFLWITRDQETGELGLACPTQVNEPAHVRAELDDSCGDLDKVGDIHSHPCSAFHSDGDIEDERHRDGVHIIAGHLDRMQPEFAATLVVRGERKELDPAKIMDLSFDFDREWLDKIHPSEKRDGLRNPLGRSR